MLDYKKFETLLKEKGVKTQDVANATGIAPSTFSDWKTGTSVPKVDKIYRISNYFGVDIEYFITEGG